MGRRVCATGHLEGPKRTRKGTEMEEKSDPIFREFYDPYWDIFARNLGS